MKVDSLTIGTYFKEELAKFTKALGEWKKCQSDWKDPVKRKAAAKKKADAAKEEGGEAKKDEVEINAEDVDVFTVEDVKDLGNDEPLFAHFAYEDWTLLSVRFELHLLCHAFRKDLDDPERPRFPAGHAEFYYNKYFKKQLTPTSMGVEDFAGLVELVKEAVAIDKEQLLEA